MLYPLDRLPIVPVLAEPESSKTRTTLTADERDEIQCVYLWLQAYSTAEAVPPPSPQPTYAELWFMLKYFRQIQLLVGSLPPWCDHIVTAHAARYLVAVGGELPRGARTLSFSEVCRWHAPSGVVGRCAAALAPPALTAMTPPFGPASVSAVGGLSAYVAAMEL